MIPNGKPTLAETMQALEAVVSSAPIEEIPSLLGLVEKIKAVGWGRMVARAQPEQQGTTSTPTLWTAPEVAQRLNRKKSFVYEMARQKKLKSVKLGKKYVMFTEEAVQNFLANGGA